MPSPRGTLVLTHRQQWVAWTCQVLCLGFLVADRWSVLHQFGFRYVDDDQAIMWNGALEMAHGRFHEPCFYGQDYNSMLEGLLAVPLLWAGVAPNVALPLVTSVLTLFPFLLLAAVLARKREFVLAAFMLAFPVTLSPEFGMITSMPRGFVTGVFLSSFAVLPLFSRRGIFLLLAPFFAVLALFANPNAVLVLAPAGLLILLEYHADRRLYLLGIAGAVPALVLYYLGHHFYEVRPDHVVHALGRLRFHAADIRWSDLRYLDELSPFLWGKGGFVFILLAALAVVLGRARQWRPAIALSVGMVLVVASMGINKVHDGYPSVFYPWARMFLAVPFLLALFLSRWSVRPRWWAMMLMPVLAAVFFSIKCLEQSKAVERQVAPGMYTDVVVQEVAALKRHCAWLDRTAHAADVGLIVVGVAPGKHLTNYGCPCLVKDLPTTIEPVLDRRTWRLEATADRVVPHVLFAEFWGNSFEGMPWMVKVSPEPPLYLVTGNSLRTDTLLARSGYGMRPH